MKSKKINLDNFLMAMIISLIIVTFVVPTLIAPAAEKQTGGTNNGNKTVFEKCNDLCIDEGLYDTVIYNHSSSECICKHYHENKTFEWVNGTWVTMNKKSCVIREDVVQKLQKNGLCGEFARPCEIQKAYNKSVIERVKEDD